MSEFSTLQVQQGLGNVGGAREDLSDIIHNIDPTETPILTAAGSTSATGIFHEWLTDVLDTPGFNAAEEGDEPTSFTAGTSATRLGNYTQIARKLVRVTGTTEVIDKAGRDSEMAYQSAIKARSLKNDVDYAISATNLARNGGSDVGGEAPPDGTGGAGTRWSASFMSFLTTPAVTAKGNAVATNGATPPTAQDGQTAWGQSNVFLDGTSATNIAQADLDAAISNAWNNGGKPTLIVCGPKNKETISQIDGTGGVGSGGVTRSDRAGRTIYATADVYVSNFGTLNVVPSRHVQSNAGNTDGYGEAEVQDGKVFLVDPEYLKVAYLRPWQQFDLAKTGDSIRREMLVEYALEVCNPSAHSVIVTNADNV